MTIFSSRNKLLNIALGLSYAIIYDHVFANYICTVFNYHASAQHVILPHTYPTYLLLSAIPFLFYRGIYSISAAFSLFIYVFAYIPILNNVLTWGYSEGIQTAYSSILFMSMCAFFLTDRLFLLKRIMTRKRHLIPFKYLELISLTLFLILIISQRGNIHFVNFMEDKQELYDMRAANSMGGNYIMAWLRSALLPLLLVCYLRKGSYTKYAACFGAYLVLFMIDMQKLTFFFPFALTGLYFIVSVQANKFSERFHIFLFVLIGTLSLWLMTQLDNPVLQMLAFIFIMRTVCIEGMIANTYLNFFEISHHPFTYYSHINIVNVFTNSNPYPQSVGLAVTDGDGNANAIFWLMDGVAAAGIYGIVIISIIFIVVKSILNTISLKCSTALCVVVMLNGIMSMVNVSLFTALFSCGFIVLYLIFLFFDLSILKEPHVVNKHKYTKI